MQGRVVTFKYSNATVRVHIPDSASDERKVRMDAIKQSAAMLLEGVVMNDAEGTYPQVYS